MTEPGVRRAALATLGLFFCWAASAAGLQVGDPAPDFELPYLDPDAQQEPTLRAGSWFAESPLTVLIVWDRSCPHCEQVALGVPALVDSLAREQVDFLGVLMGPDDPAALRDLLWDKQVSVTHLWDRSRNLAAAYDIGFRHLGVFLIDSTSTVRAVFDDKIPDLATPVVPAVRGLLRGLGGPGEGSVERETASRETLPRREGGLPIRFDARLLWLTTENAEPGDTGMFDEALRSGSLFAQRWDARLVVRLAEDWELEPMLRVSSEPDEVLVDGAEQLGSPHGTATLRGRIGSLGLILGAFPLRVSPLVMQRWDAEDASPVGGGAGCGCGPGAVGIRQGSLEVLGPDYVFEGLKARWSAGWIRVDAWAAVPDAEREDVADPAGVVYRRTLSGVGVDLGTASQADRVSGLPAPWGLRLTVVSVGQDRRTAPYSLQAHGVDRDERTATLLAGIGPWNGTRLEVEWAATDIDATVPGTESQTEGEAWRAGLRGEWHACRAVLSGHAFWIRTEDGFQPYYRALTYESDRSGPRVAIHVGIPRSQGRWNERIGATFFLRDLEEVDVPAKQAGGATRARTMSASVVIRPVGRLKVEAHVIENREWNDRYDDRKKGAVLDLRWEGLSDIDPGIRIQAVRPDRPASRQRTIWTISSSVRMLK